ncbi:hypothetical protein JCM33374_g745 [Metschnikowia sp. JCM 33374]|nr:hypothetical protein JCM33374_g745 [Metschnikowia sp. JCM 33374]
MSEKGGSSLRSSGLGGVLKSFTKSLKPASGRVPVVVTAKVIGGASDMQKLLRQLQHDALPLRVSAAVDITKALETYAVSSVPEIWYLARTLCDVRLASSVRRVAVNLMIQCIEHDSLDVSARLMYYRDILTYCSVSGSALDPEFDLFFKALRSLTENGKEIHDLCIYNQDHDWCSFITMLFRSLSHDYALRRKQKTSASSDGALISDFTMYLRNCFKFNVSILDERFTSSILKSVFYISSVTDDLVVLQSLCELVRTITVFAFIPADSYATTVSFLCSLAPLSSELLDAAWGTMSKVFCVSPFHALDATMDVFQAPELQGLKGTDVSHEEMKEIPDYKCLSTALGALSMLENMLLLCGTDELGDTVDFQYETLYWGLVDCISLNIPVMNSGVLRIFDHLFSIPGSDENSSSVQRFTTLFPFYTWYASSGSLFSLLSKLKLNSTQDQSYWTAICDSLYDRYTSSELVAPAERLVELYLLHPHLLHENIINFVMKHFNDNSLCTISDPSWKENCRMILSAFYVRKAQAKHTANVRIKALNLIKEAHERSLALSNDDSVGLECILIVLSSPLREEEDTVLQHFLHTTIYEFLRFSSLSSFQTVVNVLGDTLKAAINPESSNTLPPLNSVSSTMQKTKPKSLDGSLESDHGKGDSSQKLFCEMAKFFDYLLIELSVSSPSKTKGVYDYLISMLNFTLEKNFHRASLVIIRVLIRLRSTSKGFLYFCEPTDMNGLATTFKRNTFDETYSQNDQHWWHFPENLDYLPKKFFKRPNKQILNHIQEAGPSVLKSDIISLDLSKWLDVVIRILKECVHWELYSYTLAHLCSQLFNLSLFWHLKSHVLAIQEIICEQLMLKFPKMLTFPLSGSEMNKSDLQVALVRMLSSLIGYHDLFEKQEEDNIIKALLFGLGSWQKTAIPCIHILTICCYEISDSLKKYLIPILTKLQTGVTSVFASSAALEFLMALIHVPSLTSNFTTDEFRQVFAICFRYIEHSINAKQRGFKEKDNFSEGRYLSHGVDAEVNVQASTQSITLTPLLYQYLLVVSYEVITRWYLKIDITERSSISPFIVRNIISCSGAKSIDHLDDMTIAYLDVITRFTYSDIPLKVFTKSNTPSHGSMCRWIVGHTIVEINTGVHNGDSVITLRRPCGLSVFDLSLNPSMLLKNIDLESQKSMMLSSHLLLQLFKPLDQGTVSKPLALLDDAYTERAINAFDRIPVVSHHKAGIIYIGPGQKEEAEILSNVIGSPEYHQFLEGLGEMVRLKSCDSIYVGGLDKENGTDGEFAYFWSDKLTHLIYHTTTLMPNMPNDKYFSMKKRHIGNNHVNVFFDESGLPFNFNVIKSQFNFLNVVLTPHTIKCNEDDTRGRRFYKVITYRRNGVPGIFSTTHFKVISLEQLPHLVRNIIIMSNRFSEIWHNSVDGTYTTSWMLRVRHLNTLREKTVESHKQIKEEQESKLSPSTQTSVSKNTAISFLEQLQPHRAGDTEGLQDPTSTDKYVTGGDKDLYSLLEFNSYT